MYKTWLLIVIIAVLVVANSVDVLALPSKGP
jgi:hypothetical protein